MLSAVARDNGKIIRTGNSSGLRLTAGILKAAKIRQGDAVEIEATEEAIIIKPVRARHYDLATLVAGITSENLHREADFGRPVGAESF